MSSQPTTATRGSGTGPPGPRNDEASRRQPEASGKQEQQKDAQNTATTRTPQAHDAWKSGLPKNLVALVGSWREVLPNVALPETLQKELARQWRNALGDAVKTIPAEWYGAAQAGDRMDEVARALYDTLGHDRAAHLASELVREIEGRGLSARRGRELLDCWFREEAT